MLLLPRALLICALLCSLPLAAGAADKTALVGGRLIDGFGGRPLADSVILIDGDTIEAVGTVAWPTTPSPTSRPRSTAPAIWPTCSSPRSESRP